MGATKSGSFKKKEKAYTNNLKCSRTHARPASGRVMTCDGMRTRRSFYYQSSEQQTNKATMLKARAKTGTHHHTAPLITAVPQRVYILARLVRVTSKNRALYSSYPTIILDLCVYLPGALETAGITRPARSRSN